MKNNFTITILAFMLQELKLKGVSLLLYALVNGFSVQGHRFYMKENKILEVLNCSRSQYYQSRSQLLNRKLLFLNDDASLTTDNFVPDMTYFDEQVRIAKTKWLG